MKKIQPGSKVIVRPKTALAKNLIPDHPYLVWVVHDRDEPGTNRFQNLPPWTTTSVTIEVPIESNGVWSKECILDAEDCVLYVPPEVPAKRKPIDREAALFRLRRDMCLQFGHYPRVDPVVREKAREEARKINQRLTFDLSRLAPEYLSGHVTVTGRTRAVVRTMAAPDDDAKPELLEQLQEKGIPVPVTTLDRVLNQPGFRAGETTVLFGKEPRGGKTTLPMRVGHEKSLDFSSNRFIIIEEPAERWGDADRLLRVIKEQAQASGREVGVMNLNGLGLQTEESSGVTMDMSKFINTVNTMRARRPNKVFVIRVLNPGKLAIAIKHLADFYAVCHHDGVSVEKDRYGPTPWQFKFQ